MELINKCIYKITNKRVFSSNTYIYRNVINSDCIIIDPGFDFEIIENVISTLNLSPIAIFSTHGHFDHIGSVSYFKNRYNIPFYLHEGDLKLLQSANFYLKVAKLSIVIDLPKPSVIFKGFINQLNLNGIGIEVYNFPGHSPGSCIFKIDNFLFSGDIVYKYGIGLGSIPKENTHLLKKSILNIFEIFHIDNIIFPGHGSSELLGKIINNNIELKDFLLKDNG